MHAATPLLIQMPHVVRRAVTWGGEDPRRVLLLAMAIAFVFLVGRSGYRAIWPRSPEEVAGYRAVHVPPMVVNLAARAGYRNGLTFDCRPMPFDGFTRFNYRCHVLDETGRHGFGYTEIRVDAHGRVV